VRLTTQAEWHSLETKDKVNDLLQSVADSVSQVIPLPISFRPSYVLDDKVIQNEVGVLVGFTGDIYGRIVFQGDVAVFGKLGESMYGMPLEGEILHSFIGELANMIAGNTCTVMSNKGLKIDITPPTVMIGKLQLYGFEQGIAMPMELGPVGEVNMILMIQNKGAA
jgi:chemotaxis protein CheX